MLTPILCILKHFAAGVGLSLHIVFNFDCRAIDNKQFHRMYTWKLCLLMCPANMLRCYLHAIHSIRCRVEHSTLLDHSTSRVMFPPVETQFNTNDKIVSRNNTRSSFPCNCDIGTFAESSKRGYDKSEYGSKDISIRSDRSEIKRQHLEWLMFI